MGDTLSQAQERVLADLKRRLSRLERNYRGASIYPGAKSPGFWAIIQSATSVDPNRWKYGWSTIRWTVSGTKLGYEIPAGADTGPYTVTGTGQTGWAWNSTEMDNTDLIGGSGWEDDDVDMDMDTFRIEALNPIGTAQAGGSKFPIVWLNRVKVYNSTQEAYVFAGWNTPNIGGGGYGI